MPHEKQQLWYRFMELDENGDGRITVQELLNRHRILNGGAVDDRVRMLFPLVDEDRNGYLDYDECKALFFLFTCGRFCDACRSLIIYDGVVCVDCVLDLCSSCSPGHHHRRYRFRHRHHQNSGNIQKETGKPIKARPLHRNLYCPNWVTVKNHSFFPFPSSDKKIMAGVGVHGSFRLMVSGRHNSQFCFFNF